MSRSPVKRRSLLCGALVPTLVAAGCGSLSGGGTVDVSRLQDEIQTVVHIQKLAQGFDFDVTASCAPTSTDGLRFACVVEAATPHRKTLTWTLNVSCRPPGAAPAQRCLSDAGDALQ